MLSFQSKKERNNELKEGKGNDFRCNPGNLEKKSHKIIVNVKNDN